MFTEKNTLHAVQMTDRAFLDTVDHLGPLLLQDNIIWGASQRHNSDIWILQEFLAAKSSVI